MDNEIKSLIEDSVIVELFYKKKKVAFKLPLEVLDMQNVPPDICSLYLNLALKRLKENG
jgi:hypothetical protein